MELEFDKEIDAILRKAREPVSVRAVSPDGSHVDADAIAAVVENALPQKAKLLYMAHFADCDHCRQMLSQSMMLNGEADAADAPAVVQHPITEPSMPWYRRFFSTPGMAMAMGALVLAFTGLLGYIVIQNRGNNATEVSRVSDAKPVSGGPSHTGNYEPSAANAAAANTAAPSNTDASNTVAMPPMSSANAMANGAGRADSRGFTLDGASKEDKYAGAAPESERVVTAAPPPAPTAGQPMATGSGVQPADEKAKTEDTDAVIAAKPKSTDDRARDMPAAPKKSGAVRSGPANVQQQEMNVQSQMMLGGTIRRSVNGKSFDQRDGVWYDLAYNGQPTTNVRRGTDEYKKLDGGLRSIADELGGTVVVVWKSKNYRIQ